MVVTRARSSHPIPNPPIDVTSWARHHARPFARRHRHSYQGAAGPLHLGVKEGAGVRLLANDPRFSVPDLIPLRYQRMSASPFTSTGARYSSRPADRTRQSLAFRGCSAWATHIGNRPVRSPSARLVFDINDFDEAAIGPWEWDLKRLAASVRSADAPTKSRRTVAPPWSSAYTRTAHA